MDRVMICRVYLDRRADLCSRSDSHGDNIKDHTIEIEKYAWPDADIVAVVGTKWWSDFCAVSDLRQ
jgi:hypothetical protein